MGCFYSSLKCSEKQYSFTSEEISYLTETWNILKTTGIVKFADEVLISSSLRQYWTSKMIIDANNFDFGEGESCIRSDCSWHIGLREHSTHFILTFEKLLSSINDENLFSRQIESLQLLQNISTLEHDSLIILKTCIIDIIRERFQMFRYEFTNNYEQAWDKFLSRILKCLLAKENTIQGPTDNITSPVIIIDQPSNSASNS
ncbi:unnamed protein product [Rotaria sp. Silwood2]|nr:unnamed protein product [Rotaria sp. Silwood2]CAF2934170.1 unnamed protein product [Rotaria sp. Silwood2]CAF3966721.1 unnamed protein product [Rotaria sp. Silwood2]CAF4092785.1 unnamed protein product [Rotaria sp. Silwood2]